MYYGVTPANDTKQAWERVAFNLCVSFCVGTCMLPVFKDGMHFSSLEPWSYSPNVCVEIGKYASRHGVRSCSSSLQTFLLHVFLTIGMQANTLQVLALYSQRYYTFGDQCMQVTKELPLMLPLLHSLVCLSFRLSHM